MTSKLFSELGLSAEVLKAVDKLGFEKASPIQSEAIPIMMSGRDIVGTSQTGSGKTAAFAIPAIEKVDATRRDVQVLILCPTRELAVQVSEEVHKLCLFKKGIHVLPIYGGQSYDRQLFGLRQGVQIVIGTPGRVMDHMERGTLKLDKVKIVILDEADVMLAMGFRDDIEFVMQRVPTERQIVFFSATMPRPIQELIQKYARDPVQVKIEQAAMTVPTVEQAYYEVDRRFKIELLTRLIDIHDFKIGIVFCNTKRMVDDLVDHLNAQGYSADRLHGDMTQALRDRVMQKFRRSGLEFLVATDVAARGIDVDDVQVVFNFDLPYDVEDYVHRIGRTGRAGRSGMAISFASGREIFQVRIIERFTRMKIDRKKIPSLNEVEAARAAAFLTKLRTTLQGGEYTKQDHLIEILLEEGFTSTDIASALIHHLQANDGSGAPAAEEKKDTGDRDDRRGFGNDRGDNRGFGNDRDDRRGFGNDRDDRRGDRGDRGDRGGAPKFDRDRVPQPPRPGLLGPKPVRPAGVEKPAPKAVSAPAVVPVKAEPAAAQPEQERKPAVAPVKTLVAPKRLENKGAPAQNSLTPPPQAAPISAVVPPVVAAPRPAPAPRKAKLEDEFEDIPPHKDAPAKSPKHSRKTPDGQTRLYLSLGEDVGITKDDLSRSIMGETGLPGTVLGFVDVRERHTFFDVQAEHANAIIAKLSRANIKGKKAKAKLA